MNNSKTRKNKEKVVLFLMMAGKGTRFGAKVPKQFVLINNNKPIFLYILEQLEKIKKIDSIILITNPNYFEETKKWVKYANLKKIDKIITGGEGRSKDIFNGLISMKDDLNDDDVVLFYDATHPIVDFDGIDDVVKAIKKYGAATLGEFQYDTIYQINPKTNVITDVIPRAEVVAGASPEGFKYKLIYDIFSKYDDKKLNEMTSAGAIAIDNNIKLVVIQMKKVNLKITYSADFENFLQLMNLNND